MELRNFLHLEVAVGVGVGVGAGAGVGVRVRVGVGVGVGVGSWELERKKRKKICKMCLMPHVSSQMNYTDFSTSNLQLKNPYNRIEVV